MNNTPETFPNPEMPTIIHDKGAECPDTDGEITYPEKNNIDEAIHQKQRKKYVYETDTNNIHNLIVGQTKNQLKEKEASESTFQTVNSGRDPVG